jgi:HAE1 family hydrophobic/amphiphilic exporter-1
MARAVIGGLITSTLLTLFVVPVVYTLLDDAAAWVTSRRRRRPAGARDVRPRPIPEAATAGD